jgi:hypothetical protein
MNKPVLLRLFFFTGADLCLTLLSQVNHFAHLNSPKLRFFVLLAAIFNIDARRDVRILGRSFGSEIRDHGHGTSGV